MDGVGFDYENEISIIYKKLVEKGCIDPSKLSERSFYNMLSEIEETISKYGGEIKGIDLIYLSDPEFPEERPMVFIKYDGGEIFPSEKIELEDEIEEIAGRYPGTQNLDFIIQTTEPIPGETRLITIKFSEEDLEDKLPYLEKICGSKEEALKIKEYIRGIVIDEVEKSGKPYDESGIDALTNLLISYCTKLYEALQEEDGEDTYIKLGELFMLKKEDLDRY